jgi:phosphoribosylanthranilate isomerase
MRIKICGITSVEDALAAVREGADALGFNFHPGSPRFVTPSAARAIVRGLPPFVTAVGVFVNAGEPEEVERTARTAGVTVLQLHGDETPAYCRRLAGWSLIKALRIDPSAPAEGPSDYPVSAFLLDYRDDSRYGGTGQALDWSRLAAADWPLPLVLAGGLRPDNVRAAIRKVRPWAVDVCSGVELSPGRKDHRKMREFIEEARNADQESR